MTCFQLFDPFILAIPSIRSLKFVTSIFQGILSQLKTCHHTAFTITQSTARCPTVSSLYPHNLHKESVTLTPLLNKVSVMGA
ncbi:hypothetical protein Hanom_Chr15g01353321 [Helianthus anomalus]